VEPRGRQLRRRLVGLAHQPRRLAIGPEAGPAARRVGDNVGAGTAQAGHLLGKLEHRFDATLSSEGQPELERGGVHLRRQPELERHCAELFGGEPEMEVEAWQQAFVLVEIGLDLAGIYARVRVVVVRVDGREHRLGDQVQYRQEQVDLVGQDDMVRHPLYLQKLPHRHSSLPHSRMPRQTDKRSVELSSLAVRPQVGNTSRRSGYGGPSALIDDKGCPQARAQHAARPRLRLQGRAAPRPQPTAGRRPSAGEPAQEIERLGQHVMLGHGFQARDIEVAEQPLQRGAAFPAHAAPRGNALPIVLVSKTIMPPCFM